MHEVLQLMAAVVVLLTAVDIRVDIRVNLI
jgi:hypothetical protein